MTLHAATYAGFYQALAWTEGTNEASIKCHIPDELWDQSANDFFDFDLYDFFTVVADFDDQGIHYFTFTNEPLTKWPDIKPLTLTIYCTESDPGYEIPYEALTSHGWNDLHDRLKGT